MKEHIDYDFTNYKIEISKFTISRFYGKVVWLVWVKCQFAAFKWKNSKLKTCPKHLKLTLKFVKGHLGFWLKCIDF